MDYIKYVNSDDVRKYLYKTAYSLSLEQKIFIVDNCLFISLEEKMSLLEQIRKEADKRHKLIISDYTGRREISTLEFLNRILYRYLKMVRLFKEESHDCYYLFEIKEEDTEPFYTQAKFSTYGDCISYKEKLLNNDNHFFAFRIRKIYLTSLIEENISREKYVIASFNPDFYLMDLDCCGFSEEIDDISTDALICYLPMPFKKGDILKRKSYSYSKASVNPEERYSTHCVFCKGIPSEEKNTKLMDASDIIIYGWYFDRKKGKIKLDHFEHRYDFEYLKEDLLPKDCPLYSISAFLNNEKDFHEEEAILTALYHLECYREKEYQKTKDNPLLEYAVSDECIKEEIRSKYTLNKRLSCAFNMIDDSVRIWLDDERIAPSGYYHCHSVNEAISRIRFYEKAHVLIEEINLDHDLGDYAKDGGDAVNILDWLEKRQTFYPVKIHTANPVSRRNMERILEKHWPKDEQEF